MRIHKADLLTYFDGKHPKELYIPAMNIIINKEDYILLIKLNKDLVLENEKVKVIDYETNFSE